MWLKAFEVDFNSPWGTFIIHEDAEDYKHGDAYPHVGEDVFLVNMEAKTRNRDGNFYNAGFGMVCQVTGVRISESDGKRIRIYDTDHFDRRFKK